MNYPCNLIQDLFPACLDGSCSPETEAAVAQHLQQCISCRQQFRQRQEEDAQWEYEMNQLEKWGIAWTLKEFLLRCSKNRIALLKGAALMAAGIAILAGFWGAWWGLTQQDMVSVPSADYQVLEALQLPEGEIFCSYQSRYVSTFTHHYLIVGRTVYFPAKRPILDKSDTCTGRWIMDPDSVWDKASGTYVPVDAIYLGNPEDAILIWKRGMPLSAASDEDLARIDGYERIIF